MIKKIVLFLIIGGTFSLIGFQLYTMYGMVISAQDVSLEIEEGTVIRQGNESDSRIAFTCNVDWGEDVLPDMLDIFQENDIKITFFISGKWAKKNPWLLRKIFVLGHEVQNHGYGHRLCSKISGEEVLDEIIKTQEAIEHLIGIKTNIFAPPAGDYDDKTVNICKEQGYILSLWSVDTIDWKPGSTADVIKSRVFKKNLNGAILLMHPKEETVKALPSIISEIENKGLSIVSISELMCE